MDSVSRPARTPDSTTLIAGTMDGLQNQITGCRLCPRLVEWRERVASEKVRRFQDQEYWGKPVPSFGDREGRLLIVGLAPAAHGANRTGRMFTGDESGVFLYRALHKAGFASQPVSTNRNDGLALKDCYISAVLHCAPPGNKPLPEEIRNCRDYLAREIGLLGNIQVVAALGRIAFDHTLAVFEAANATSPGSREPHRNRPRFGHGVECNLGPGVTLIASFHPSQQNTFTGKLTEAMFDMIFSRARALLAEDS